MLSNLSNPPAFRMVGVESGMAHTRRQLVEQFYLKHKEKLLASARRIDPQAPMDLVQEVLEWMMRPTRKPTFTFMEFVRRMNGIAHRRSNHQERTKTGFKYVKKGVEVQGDIDRLWRRRHGRKTGVKGGAE